MRTDHGPGDDTGGQDREDSGSATVFVLGFTVVLLAMAGLVIDGGLALNARQRVADDVEQAARAGSQNLDQNALRADGTVQIDADAADIAATDYLLARKYTSYVVTATPGKVVVTATTTQPTTLLSLIFIKNFTITATGQAEPAVGGN